MDARELLISPIALMPPAGILDGLKSAQSAEHLSGASHSVVEIVAHMVQWQSCFLQRCAGLAIPLVSKASLGWPTANVDEWHQVRERFLEDLDRALETALNEAACVLRVDHPIEFPLLELHRC
jgi:hypothetical protein